jgi:hypothetical protein
MGDHFSVHHFTARKWRKLDDVPDDALTSLPIRVTTNTRAHLFDGAKCPAALINLPRRACINRALKAG